MTGPLSLAGYKLTFDDEFNSFSSNGPSNPFVTSHTGTWDTTYAYGERKLNDEVQLYSDPTVGVNPFSDSNGVLTITAAPSTDRSASWGQPYTSGAITTLHSFSQRYGYFEMRAELPDGVGMWPAFWMVSKQHVWPPELDPLEAFGSNGSTGEGGAYSFHNGLVKTDSGGQGAWNSTNGANLYTQYNTFGVDWQPDRITFYFNGQAYASVATPTEFNQPMYLLANLAVGGNWAGAPIGETAALKIDYIRAFSHDQANPAVAQQRISSPDGRGYSFYGAVDANANGALGGIDLPAPAPTAPAPIPPAPTGDQTVGSGPDDLVLYMSENYYKGDAQFIVTIDGSQRGGVLSTSALDAAGATQKFNMRGTFGAGVHTASIYLLNKVQGAPGVDRNLFLSGASINGTAINIPVLNEYVGGAQGFSFAEFGTLVLHVSEDAYKGDAQFVVSVDGQPVGGIQTATAIRDAGQSQDFTLTGKFGSVAHTVGVTFLNDAWGGTAATDRNLIVDAVDFNGSKIAGAGAVLWSNGTADLAVPGITDTITFNLSEDAYQGDAQAIVSIDGRQLGGVQTITASHALSQSQAIRFMTPIGAGPHVASVRFLNDAWGGTSATDRNLFVGSIDLNGIRYATAAAALCSNGASSFSIPGTTTPAPAFLTIDHGTPHAFAGL